MSWERTFHVFVRELVVLRGHTRPVWGPLGGKANSRVVGDHVPEEHNQSSEGHPKYDEILRAGFKQGSGMI